jgi:putative flippase GtrA
MEIIRFGVVGLTATAMHYLTLILMVELLAIPPTLANGLAFLCALFITYLGQSLWVFQERSQHSITQMLRFTVSLGVGLLSNMAIMAVSMHALGLGYQNGFLLSLLLVPVLSFMINRFWVFNSS